MARVPVIFLSGRSVATLGGMLSLLSLLSLSIPCEATPEKDSLLHWLATDQIDAWTRACASESPVRDQLFEMGLADYTAPDEVEWKLLRLAKNQLSECSVLNPRIPLDPEEVKRQMQFREARPWMLACAVFALLGGSAALWMRWLRARQAREVGRLAVWPEATPFLPWMTGGLRPKVAFDAAAWKRLMQETEPAPRSPRWQLLSASERDCAEMLHEGLRVEEIAQRLAVSASYVYNLRSSIRRKWDLSESDDLLQAIRTELTAAPPATDG